MRGESGELEWARNEKRAAGEDRFYLTASLNQESE